MVKFLILFRQPEDAEKFETVYQDFLALVERIPNIQRRQVVHVTGSPLGSPEYYRILEVYFESAEIQHEALMSPIGQEAGRELGRLPVDSFLLLFADVYEEEGGGAKQEFAEESDDADETEDVAESDEAVTKDEATEADEAEESPKVEAASDTVSPSSVT